MTRTTLVAFTALFFPGCISGDPVTKLPAYHGLSRAAVLAKLGQPERDENISLAQTDDEFRRPLQNTYPLSIYANTNVQIEELWWSDGNYHITLWLHQVNGDWVVFDSCRWRKDVRF